MTDESNQHGVPAPAAPQQIVLRDESLQQIGGVISTLMHAHSESQLKEKKQQGDFEERADKRQLVLLLVLGLPTIFGVLGLAFLALDKNLPEFAAELVRTVLAFAGGIGTGYALKGRTQSQHQQE